MRGDKNQSYLGRRPIVKKMVSEDRRTGRSGRLGDRLAYILWFSGEIRHEWRPYTQRWHPWHDFVAFRLPRLELEESVDQHYEWFLRMMPCPCLPMALRNMEQKY